MTRCRCTPLRVHFQPLFLFRCVLPEWPRSARPGRTRHLYMSPRWRCSYLFRTHPFSVLHHRRFGAFLSLTVLAATMSPSLFRTLSDSLPAPLDAPCPPTDDRLHFDRCISVCLVPADLHTFFRGQLSVIRRSTWIDGEEWHNSARERATSLAVRAGGWRRAESKLQQGVVSGNAFNKDR